MNNNRFKWSQNWEKILNNEIQKEYHSAFRKLLLKYDVFEYKCNKCGIEEWNGSKITLEIEHKDGNRFNNSKNNLELLCPNCHSQTSTFRKNRQPKNNRKNISDYQILEQLELCDNINQVLNNLNLSNSGGNYKRIHKIIKENNKEEFYNLPQVITHEKKSFISLEELKNKRINIIKESNIDFSKNTWGIKLSKLFGISSYGTRTWIKKNLPDFWEKCAKHKKDVGF
jgi:Zn finger protein HypA/HybF involved in hydrogenase expression